MKLWECGAQGYGTKAHYCCESAAESTRCCSTSSVLFEMAAATVGAFTGASASATTTSESSTGTHRTVVTITSAAATSTSIDGVTASSPKSQSNGAIIGGAVGGTLAGLAILGIGGFFLWRWRKGRQTSRITPTDELDPALHEKYATKGSYVYAQSNALDSPDDYTHVRAGGHHTPLAELSSIGRTSELAVDS